MDDRAVRFVNLLVGRKLENFCCEAEILDFGFGRLVLHAMGCSRVIKGEDILVTTLDYQSWDYVESTNNDEWYNMERFRSGILGGSVVSVQVTPWNDLLVRMDNEVMIECLVANAYPHYEKEQEQWMLFEPSGDGSGTFLMVYNKSVDFHDRNNKEP